MWSATLQLRLRWTFGVLMAVTYVLTLTAKAVDAAQGTRFLASIGPVVVTFLTMNVFYVQYFRTCGRSTPFVCGRPAAAGQNYFGTTTSLTDS